jgi:enoyl-CoA hydratase/carnithine racemase
MLDLHVANNVAVLTLARSPVNALNDAWMDGFHRVLDNLDGRRDWTVLHLRSALKVFSAGADLKQLQANFDQPAAVQAEVGRRYQALFNRVEALEAVTLAEIGGTAVGGGLELALACDLRAVSREARLGLPEVKLGLIPGAGGTQRLTLLCGRAQASRLVLGGEIVDGAEAFDLGLAQWVFDAAGLPAGTAAIAVAYAALPRQALAAAKACIRIAAAPTARGLDAEFEQVSRLLGSEETRALVGAFLAKSGS